ncbi:TrpB-like pyridoxal phosphate-dependent enzyme [Desulfoscipio geothermicus]|uniref:Tryptophan synthase beta chain n=1 Tax=Desulfoscipio geothermicus DSM 3669 TaxID=1121426 RepID=A0A1I6CTF0_9FIRM|nr:TrpB-like pyridoxal phosphate-dependent enzyme [Desulfoscipio geothermicus]SFQ96498.1 tryptophan synthase, beta chain [Desulfoscipio geothermicus DSM 3669]
MSENKILLTEKEMPRQWYNVMADMPNLPKPPLHPATQKPVGPEDLSAIFPMELIKQEVSTERWIDIPEEVQKIYRLWRPSPLCRARRLEKALDTPAKIFYKYEGVSPAGSHKLNTAVPQAYYNKKEGINRLTTETGAGQWGVALSQACNFFGMECRVFMVKVSYEQKPYRRSMMQIFGSSVVPSPSNETAAGRKVLAADPDSPGSLGIAISEAVEVAAQREDTNYALGSVLNHVILHQTVIGQEAKEQMAKAGEYPNIVIGCCGGGSNFAGTAFPFVYDKLVRGAKIRLIAAEPSSCPTLTRGRFGYDFGDVAGLTPLLSMYTLGSEFMPPSIHAGGLRYHGDSPLVSQLLHDGIIEATALDQTSIFEGAIMFARSEGIVPAPESAHAIQCAINEALAAKEAGEARTILFTLSGHGLLDLPSYDKFMAGKLEDFPLPEDILAKSLQNLPKI